MLLEGAFCLKKWLGENIFECFIYWAEIVSVKIPVGKGCGFVQFANRCSSFSLSLELNNKKSVC
jgi:hypothetical protein